jgi:hypothetical protein
LHTDIGVYRMEPRKERNGQTGRQARKSAGNGVATSPGTLLWRPCNALDKAANGDFSLQLPTDGHDPLLDEVTERFNRIVRLNETVTQEMVRLERVVARVISAVAAGDLRVGHVARLAGGHHPHGRDDAGHGRVRDDARHPGESGTLVGADPRRTAKALGAIARSVWPRAPRIIFRSRSTRIGCSI